MWLTLTDYEGSTFDINTDHIVTLGPDPHRNYTRITTNMNAAGIVDVRQPRDLIRRLIGAVDLTTAYTLTLTTTNGDTTDHGAYPTPAAAWAASFYLVAPGPARKALHEASPNGTGQVITASNTWTVATRTY